MSFTGLQLILHPVFIQSAMRGIWGKWNPSLKENYNVFPSLCWRQKYEPKRVWYLCFAEIGVLLCDCEDRFSTRTDVTEEAEERTTRTVKFGPWCSRCILMRTFWPNFTITTLNLPVCLNHSRKRKFWGVLKVTLKKRQEAFKADGSKCFIRFTVGTADVLEGKWRLCRVSLRVGVWVRIDPCEAFYICVKTVWSCCQLRLAGWTSDFMLNWKQQLDSHSLSLKSKVGLVSRELDVGVKNGAQWFPLKYQQMLRSKEREVIRADLPECLLHLT